MKLSYDSFNDVLEWNINQVPILCIENKLFLRNLLKEFMYKESKEANSLRLFNEKNEEIPNVLLVDSPVLFDFNNLKTERYLTNILIDNLNNQYEIKLNIENNLRSILFNIFTETNFQIDISEQINIKQLMKLFDINIVDDSENDLGSVINYLELITSISPETMIIFDNLKMYFSEQDVLELYKYILLNEINVLLIETSNNILMNEKVFIIDDDLCEIF